MWRLVDVPDGEEVDTDLTDAELIGVNIMLTHNAGEPRDSSMNVYWRARQKIQTQVAVALDRDA